MGRAATCAGTRKFAVARDGNAEIYRQFPTGAQVNLTNHPDKDSDPAVSGDSLIVFQSDRDGNDEIYVMEIDGSNATRLTFNAGDHTHALRIKFADYERLVSPDVREFSMPEA